MKIRSILLWLLVIIWMIVIFSFSSNVAEESNSKSKKIAHTVVDIVEKEKNKKEKDIIVEKANKPIRKIAHGFEYCILGILLFLALSTHNISNKKKYIITLIICIIYASTDEIHQLYINGRYGDYKDVLVDTLGSSIGLLFCCFGNRCLKKN